MKSLTIRDGPQFTCHADCLALSHALLAEGGDPAQQAIYWFGGT